MLFLVRVPHNHTLTHVVGAGVVGAGVEHTLTHLVSPSTYASRAHAATKLQPLIS